MFMSDSRPSCGAKPAQARAAVAQPNRQGIVVLVLSALMVFAMAVMATADDYRRITVQGQGVISATPDMATVMIGVEKTAETPMDAVNQTNAAMAAVMDRLADLGIGPEYMQSSGVDLSQEWQHDRDTGRQIVVGHTMRNTLGVQIRELDQLGAVLQAVLEDGANTLSSLQFGLVDPRPLRDEARRIAVSDAIAKAELYAEAAGLTLGDVMKITETSAPVYVPTSSMMRVEAVQDVPVAAGQTTVSQSVTVIFAIEG